MLVLNFVILGLKNNRQILPILAQVNAVRSDNIVNVSNIDYTNIYAEKTSYYLMYMDLCQLDDTLFHRLPEYDINKFIEKLKPMYFNYNGSSTFNKDHRFIISPKTLKQYILIAPKLYQRKNTLNK